MAEKQFLTKKGYEERVALLENLKVVRRKEVAQKLKEAREQGDLSENAEYDAAKDEQRDIEAQIVELENILKNAEATIAGIAGPIHPEITSRIPFPMDLKVIFSFFVGTEFLSVFSKFAKSQISV